MAAGNSKLCLGGHSFIGALGNDPPASFDVQCEIVTSCLDSGITWFDTTYYQERIALGKTFRKVGRRDEASIIAWNFFKGAGGPDDLFSFTPFEMGHIDSILGELQTDVVDLLVIHAHDNRAKLQDEIGLALEWRKAGKIRSLGLGIAELKYLDTIAEASNGFSAILAPYNVFNKAPRDLFLEARRRSIRTFAMSPFIRGWKLDQPGLAPADVADLLLRWVTAQDIVDHVIVSMRMPAWVETNLRSELRGKLTGDEEQLVASWIQPG